MPKEHCGFSLEDAIGEFEDQVLSGVIAILCIDRAENTYKVFDIQHVCRGETEVGEVSNMLSAAVLHEEDVFEAGGAGDFGSAHRFSHRRQGVAAGGRGVAFARVHGGSDTKYELGAGAGRWWFFGLNQQMVPRVDRVVITVVDIAQDTELSGRGDQLIGAGYLANDSAASKKIDVLAKLLGHEPFIVGRGVSGAEDKDGAGSVVDSVDSGGDALQSIVEAQYRNLCVDEVSHTWLAIGFLAELFNSLFGDRKRGAGDDAVLLNFLHV